ncbi:CDP-diacylglycerol--serine O-phosphatidyltransferase [Archaeoglobus neptunius]|uniref:CDP-diacylglycerol--serine O-phosphatidyltransferase n=1 Tax=Archaeoglobus neptunius TaxID=2798580 RepID=UPI0019256718|nr:CDP-diacylglycerol--serine O-phosphatidyltransferase [Archaeoglobus neptunius]
MRVFREVSLADSFTVLNALFGFSAIVYVLLYGIEAHAFALFYLSTFADGIDGFVARKTEKSPFGKEMDSLADSISFGVFPAVLMVRYSASLFPFAALLLAFSILRLARFNTLKFSDFYGVPTLVTALIITSLIRISGDYYTIALSAFALSFLMISDIIYPRIRDPIIFAVLGVVLISAIFFAEMCIAILILTGIYVIYPVIKEVMGRWKQRKVKKLLSKQE